MTANKQRNQSEIRSLSDYINDNHSGNQSAFARANGVQRAQVAQWLKAGYIVVGNKLCAIRRELAQDS